MKKIIEFKINKTIREKREEIVKNEAGEDVKKEIELSKKVTSTFSLRKPTRSLHDEAELYYGVKLGEGIKAGIVGTDGIAAVIAQALGHQLAVFVQIFHALGQHFDRSALDEILGARFGDAWGQRDVWWRVTGDHGFVFSRSEWRRIISTQWHVL